MEDYGSMFDGAGASEVQVNRNLRFDKPGRYPGLKVLSCRGKKARQGPAIYFIVDLEVVGEPVKTEKEEPIPVGAKVSWLVTMNDHYGYGLKDSKAFALAADPTLAGKSAKDIDTALKGSLTGGFDGKMVEANVYTKENGYVTVQFAKCSTPPVAAPSHDEDGPWFPFPEKDPRHGKLLYNAKGETKGA